MLRLASAFAIAALISGPARAENLYFLTGNDLYSYCEEDAYGRALCLGASSAYLDMMQIQGFTCNTAGVTRAQIRDVLIKHLRDHPETRNRAAANNAVLAYVAAFNCKK